MQVCSYGELENNLSDCSAEDFESIFDQARAIHAAAILATPKPPRVAIVGTPMMPRVAILGTPRWVTFGSHGRLVALARRLSPLKDGVTPHTPTSPSAPFHLCFSRTARHEP